MAILVAHRCMRSSCFWSRLLKGPQIEFPYSRSCLTRGSVNLSMLANELRTTLPIDDDPEILLLLGNFNWLSIEVVRVLWVAEADMLDLALACVECEEPLLRPSHESTHVWLKTSTALWHPAVELGVVGKQLHTVRYLRWHIVDKVVKSVGPRTEPCGMPLVTGTQEDFDP